MSRAETPGIHWLSCSAYAGMFVFGIVMALLGAILPALAGHLQFQTRDIGTLFLVMNGAMLAASLALGVVMDRFGMQLPLTAGSLLVAAALMLAMLATAFRDLLWAVLLLGIGGAALNGATNTLVADLYADPGRKTAALNRLGIFFGFGALFLPFVMGALLSRVRVGALLAAAGVLCLGAACLSGALRFPAPKQRHALPLAEMPRFLRTPLVLAFAALLFFESGVEFTLGGFISTYLTHDVKVDSLSVVSWILAAYWAALMVARAAWSRLAAAPDPYSILRLCAACACAGALLAAVAHAPVSAALAVVVCGASLAGVYPAALGIAGDRFQSHSGTVFGILFAVALAGGMALPWLAGQIGGAAGLRWAFVLIAGAFGAVFGLSCLAARFDPRHVRMETA